MSSSTENEGAVGRAEKAFRDAFDRLKRGKPERLPKDTLVSQNNVAREAGCDPTALRKSRYPSLVAEIKQWIADHSPDSPPSSRQKLIAGRRRNRSLREKYEAIKVQRDHALSLLGEADAKILDLTLECARSQAQQPQSNVVPIRGVTDEV
jgi:hypothetical protein